MTLLTWAQTPAFPGAEGHGRYVTGGRGGKVVHVTNLNDSGTGSFRQAVNGSEKKIVVFDVGGVIALKSDLTIGANTTVEGQTAPAPGITLRYYTVQPESNVIIRFMRFRRGQEKDVNDGADAMWQRHKNNILIDHCSFSWSIDEVASFYDNNNFTMQWCMLGESLNNAGHGKGAHGYGGIWGGKLASFHHNMICHVGNRSPRFNGARYNWSGYTGNDLYSEYQWQNAVQSENVDFRNCVIYNCGNGCYGGPGGGQVNIVNNFYKTGPAAGTSLVTTASVANSTSASGYTTYWGMFSRYYIDGNLINGSDKNWNAVKYDDGTKVYNNERYTPDPNHYYGSGVTYVNIDGTDCVRIKMDSPAPVGEVTTHDATTAFNKVLAYGGASLVRDNVDERYETEARNGTATYTGSVTGKKGRIDLVSDVNGYTEANFGTGSRPSGFDTDRDGIPDEWETANGLDPNNANDAAMITLDSMGYYTNLEVYLNSLVQDIMLNGNADGDGAVQDYYPAYTKEDGTKVEAINGSGGGQETQNVSYTLSQSTNVASGNTSSTYQFNNGVTITNNNGKTYAAGYENGIKYSAAVQYTINLPSGVSINKITFTGYDNYADVDAYLGEVAGTEYSATDYVFPQKNGSTYTVKSHTIEFASPVSGAITFTPMGKQCVFVIQLSGTKGGTTALDVLPLSNGSPVETEYYDLQGRRLNGPQKGLVIRIQRFDNGQTVTNKIIIR